MDWEKAKEELNKKLDPAHVKPPSKFGPKGDYIEGWHAIAEANRIFGHGAWSYTIKLMTQESLVQGQDSNGKPQWQAAYTCIVTLQVGEAIREDVGFGSGFAKNVGDAIEGATKEAVTDALKRALRTFGNPFGLALYDKSRANVGVDHAPQKVTQEEAEILTDLAKRAGTDRAKVFAAMKLEGDSWADLPAEWFIGVRKKMQAKIDQMDMEHDAAVRAADPAMQAPDAHQYQ